MRAAALALLLLTLSPAHAMRGPAGRRLSPRQNGPGGGADGGTPGNSFNPVGMDTHYNANGPPGSPGNPNAAQAAKALSLNAAPRPEARAEGDGADGANGADGGADGTAADAAAAPAPANAGRPGSGGAGGKGGAGGAGGKGGAGGAGGKGGKGGEGGKGGAGIVTVFTTVTVTPTSCSTLPPITSSSSTTTTTSSTTTTAPSTTSVSSTTSSSATSSSATSSNSTTIPPSSTTTIISSTTFSPNATSITTSPNATTTTFSANITSTTLEPSSTTSAPVVIQSSPVPELIRGVNLGGWLVFERWIRRQHWADTLPGEKWDDKNPTYVRDEWMFGKLEPRADAERWMREHWDTFVTEDDFRQIKAAGLTHVRIPIGYWSFQLRPGDPHIQGAKEYLDKAIVWARNNGLKVMIDLHGVPGGQNTWDHSGKLNDFTWYNTPSNIELGNKVIAEIATTYYTPENKDVVTHLFMLNEPDYNASHDNKPIYWQALKSMTGAAYQALRNEAHSDAWLVLHDSWTNQNVCCNSWLDGSHSKLMGDNHYYPTVFDPAEKWRNATIKDLIEPICGAMNGRNGWSMPVVTGEWSVATPGKYPFNDIDWTEGSRMLWDAQTQMFEQYGAGWTYWTWKIDGGGAWSFKDMIRDGVIPHDLNSHKYKLQDLCPGRQPPHPWLGGRS